jgi:glutamyl-tRNA synthetase
LLRPDGNGKLSKRDGDRLGFPVFPTDWYTAEGELYSGYREKGYFPGAFINMLAFLGWNPGTPQEIFSLEELCDVFTLDRVSKAGAKFDPDKTKWFQQQYLRNTPEDLLAEMLAAELEQPLDEKSRATICHLMKERATFVRDILSDGEYLFHAPTT